MTVEDDGTESLGGIWDYRDDPEGIYFAPGSLADRAEHVERLWQERVAARKAALGYMVQPPDRDQEPLS